MGNLSGCSGLFFTGTGCMIYVGDIASGVSRFSGTPQKPLECLNSNGLDFICG
nr:MAG TPA: hypothetical protein [Caudoviricetes sp.]